MDKNINIINSKENVLELDIEITGIKPNKSECFFVIKTSKVDFSFTCKYINDTKWEVIIPPLPNIENTLYNFYVYMVVDGYYFKPYEGTVNIVKSNEIYVKDIKNTKFESSIDNSIIKDKNDFESIDLDDILNNNKYSNFKSIDLDDILNNIPSKKIKENIHKSNKTSITDNARTKTIMEKENLIDDKKIKESKVKNILAEMNMPIKNKSLKDILNNTKF